MAKRTKKKATAPKRSQDELRSQITQKIIDALEDGKRPWVCPWRKDPNCGFPVSVISKKHYRGINVLLLEVANMIHGFRSKWWGTYKQWQERGGQVQARPKNVQPGEWGTEIVFWKWLRITDDKDLDSKGKPKVKKIPMLRTYTVFNLDQVDTIDKESRQGKNLDSLRPAPEEESDTPLKLDADWTEAKGVIDATGADIRYKGSRAFYKRPSGGEWPKHKNGDYIQMPPLSKFPAVGEFFDTAFHELAHWTEVRLKWDHEKESYAMGELVAEITACYMAGFLGLPQSDDLTNHTRYLKSWLEGMKGDSRFIIQASAQASKATDYLLHFCGKAENPLTRKYDDEDDSDDAVEREAA